MRELEVQEIYFVGGGACYSWWSIPLYAGAASTIANTAGGLIHGFAFYRALATGIQFGVPAAIASIVLLAGIELSANLISMLPLPSFQNVPSCHG